MVQMIEKQVALGLVLSLGRKYDSQNGRHWAGENDAVRDSLEILATHATSEAHPRIRGRAGNSIVPAPLQPYAERWQWQWQWQWLRAWCLAGDMMFSPLERSGGLP